MLRLGISAALFVYYPINLPSECATIVCCCCVCVCVGCSVTTSTNLVGSISSSGSKKSNGHICSAQTAHCSNVRYVCMCVYRRVSYNNALNII